MWLSWGQMFRYESPPLTGNKIESFGHHKELLCGGHKVLKSTLGHVRRPCSEGRIEVSGDSRKEENVLKDVLLFSRSVEAAAPKKQTPLVTT